MGDVRAMGSDAEDEVTFEAWYEATYPGVYRSVAALTKDRNLAADIASEAFARAFQRWPAVASKDHPEAWVHRVAINLAKREWKRRARERDLKFRPLGVGADPLGHDPQLWGAVDSLPSRQREVVVLRYVADLTEQQIAATLRLSVGAVSSALSAARRALSNDERIQR